MILFKNKEEVEKLRNQFYSQVDENNRLLAENNNLYRKYQEYKIEVEKLKYQLKVQAFDNDQLLREEIESLKNELYSYITKNDKLISENSLLQRKYQEYKTKIEQLTDENLKLKTSYSNSINKNIEVVEKYKLLESYYQQLCLKQKNKTDNCKTVSEKKKNIYNMPITYQKLYQRKTSLEIWKDKLEKFINSKVKNQNYKKEVEIAVSKMESCKKGVDGENYLLKKLLELKKNDFFKDMIILQDLCFQSPIANANGYKANIQIDFLVITNYVIFIFDSKNRTGIEKIDENSKSFLNMQKYRKCVIELISENYLKSEFGMTEKNIYAVMVYSGKNQVNHSGITVKSTDNGSGYCEEYDEIKYVFADNLVEDMCGVYSHAVRKHKSLGFCELNSIEVSKLADIILNYVSNNGYDFSGKCPLCGRDIVKRSGANGEFIGCTGYPDCKYNESI